MLARAWFVEQCVQFCAHFSNGYRSEAGIDYRSVRIAGMAPPQNAVARAFGRWSPLRGTDRTK